jgi:hypothetical protein
LFYNEHQFVTTTVKRINMSIIFLLSMVCVINCAAMDMAPEQKVAGLNRRVKSYSNTQELRNLEIVTKELCAYARSQKQMDIVPRDSKLDDLPIFCMDKNADDWARDQQRKFTRWTNECLSHQLSSESSGRYPIVGSPTFLEDMYIKIYQSLPQEAQVRRNLMLDGQTDQDKRRILAQERLQKKRNDKLNKCGTTQSISDKSD